MNRSAVIVTVVASALVLVLALKPTSKTTWASTSVNGAPPASAGLSFAPAVRLVCPAAHDRAAFAAGSATRSPIRRRVRSPSTAFPSAIAFRAPS